MRLIAPEIKAPLGKNLSSGVFYAAHCILLRDYRGYTLSWKFNALFLTAIAENPIFT